MVALKWGFLCPATPLQRSNSDDLAMDSKPLLRDGLGSLLLFDHLLLIICLDTVFEACDQVGCLSFGKCLRIPSLSPLKRCCLLLLAQEGNLTRRSGFKPPSGIAEESIHSQRKFLKIRERMKVGRTGVTESPQKAYVERTGPLRALLPPKIVL